MPLRLINLADHSLTLWGAVNNALLIPLRSNPSVTATLRMIFAAACASALTYQLLAVLNRPRLTRFPDDFQSLGFSPCFGRVSSSKNEAAEVLPPQFLQI